VTKDSIDQMFKNYNEYRGRCAHLEVKITETEKIIERLKETLIDDNVRITTHIDGMPPAQKGTSDPTGKLGAKVAAGYESDHIRQAEYDLAAFRQEFEQKAITVKFVNAWLQALDLKERFIIEQKVIGGLSWRQLVFAFNREFGESYSQDGLKRIGQKAREKIYNIAQ
jgi:hypothetical protein